MPLKKAIMWHLDKWFKHRQRRWTHKAEGMTTGMIMDF